jgi:colicin import membrane protein
MILERPEEPGKKYALAFTVLVHAGLILALFMGVQWKNKQPEVMEVELWSPTPQQATYVPRPPPPPEPEVKPEPKPEPKPLPKVEPKPEAKPLVKPEIAVKEEKKKPEPKKPEPKPEPPKPEPKKPEPKPEPKKVEPKPEAKPQPKFDFSKELSRETSELKPKTAPSAQQLANAAAAESEQRAASAAAAKSLKSWGDKVSRHVRQYVVLPGEIQGNPQTIFELRVLPSGDVVQPIRLKKSSGNSALDAAVERAIIKASPLPKPESGSFPNPLEIKYKPLEE